MRTFFALMISLCCSIGAIADNKTVTFTVSPKMSCSNCENKIKSNLRHEKGIVDITPSAKKQTVVVKYNTNKTTQANIVAAFRKIGYTATEVKQMNKKTETKKNGNTKKQNSSTKKNKKQSGDNCNSCSQMNDRNGQQQPNGQNGQPMQGQQSQGSSQQSQGQGK
jgi:copper chaperone CopZ